MSDLQIPKRTELEKRLADALADLLSIVDGERFYIADEYQNRWDNARRHAHDALARYNAKIGAELFSQAWNIP